MIAIIDYKAGNLTSVARALQNIGESFLITDDIKKLEAASHIIFPGVGAAGDLLLGPARAGFAEQLSAHGYRPEAAIHLAAMGNDAGIVGAADLARR